MLKQLIRIEQLKRAPKRFTCDGVGLSDCRARVSACSYKGLTKHESTLIKVNLPYPLQGHTLTEV